MNKVSCVIHTYNSEIYLEKVLRSVSEIDEIVIIDMYSDDSTLDIAKRYDAKIFMHDNVGFADPARQFGLDCCSNDWVISLDSDEILLPEAIKRVKKIISDNQHDVIYLSRVNFMFGREVKGGGWGFSQDVIPRVFRKKSMRYTGEVHNFMKIDPDARKIRIIGRDVSIVHYNYIDVSHWLRKINQYTDVENLTNDSLRHPYRFILYHFLREFFGRFFLLRGFRDGWIGAYLALSMAFYRATVLAKESLPDAKVVVEAYIRDGN